MRNFLFNNNSIVSNEKVENVVKDPKTPIIKKYLIISCEKFLEPNIIIKYPIRKDPIILTISVLINK